MQADTRHTNLLFYLLMAAVALGFFYNTHAIPLFDLDEGAFSEATREMFLRGDFISTYLNGEPRYDKPILIYWLQAASVALFGVNEFAFRLPSMLAATAWVAAVFLFVKTVKDAQTACYAAIMMATALEISVMGRAATADALLNLWITAAMLSSFLFYRSRRGKHLYLAFLFMALGFLTKGPVAVMIPLVVSLLFFTLKGDFKIWLRAVCNPIGIVIFLLVAMPWYVAQYLKEGDAFIQGFFFKHNVGRFQEGMEGHTGNVLYYIPVILLGVLPYTTVLLSSVVRIRQIINDDLRLFLGLWFGFVLVFFSLSGTKLPHYIVYGFVPLFVLMALHIPDLKAKRLLFLPPLLFFAVLFFLPEIIANALPGIKDPFVRSALADYREYFTSAYRIFFAAAAAFTLYFMVERRYAGVHKLFASGLLTVFALAQFVVPIVAGIQQQPIKEAALLAKQRDYEVVMWKLNTPSFNVYSERLVQKREPRAGDVVLTKAIYLPGLAGFEVLYQKNGIALVRVLR
ncbi:MAG: ArnT family glycosyltransferase [Pseudomonadota bacterium]